jgi:hypothetical protein
LMSGGYEDRRMGVLRYGGMGGVKWDSEFPNFVWSYGAMDAWKEGQSNAVLVALCHWPAREQARR